MSNLSPTAQAVLDAYRDADIDDAVTAAAVLRAAATQVTPVSTNARQMTIRTKLLNIADELEAQ
jgi:hypothetical protein